MATSPPASQPPPPQRRPVRSSEPAAPRARRARRPPLFDLDAAIAARLPADRRDLAMVHLGAMRLGRIVEIEFQELLAPARLERSEHAVLLTLWLAGPPHQLTPTQLSAAVIQTTSGMSKTLRRLERAELVEIAPNPADGRGQLVVLTEAGHQLVERHFHQLLDYWDELLESYGDRDRVRLARQFWTLLAVVEPSFELGAGPNEA